MTAMADCFTCDVRDGTIPTAGGQPIYKSPLVLLTHHDDPHPDIAHENSRAGWLIVSPIRHVARTFELTAAERHELADLAALADAALTTLYGSRRTMIASLGWYTSDHIHIHCAPTFDAHITRGWENFGTAYTPLPLPSSVVATQIRHAIGQLIETGSRAQAHTA